jgi:hypothetical protein
MEAEMVPVSEAARRLGVTPARIRQRIVTGSIRAHKVGPVWLVDATSLTSGAGGRPLSARGALVVGSAYDRIAPFPAYWEHERTHAKAAEIRRTPDEELPAVLLRLFRRRATRHDLHVPSDRVHDLRRDARVLPSGLSYPVTRVVGGLPRDFFEAVELEAYVDAWNWPSVVADHALDLPVADPSSANVTLRVGGWLLPVVPRLFSAVDLLERCGATVAATAVAVTAAAVARLPRPEDLLPRVHGGQSQPGLPRLTD